MLDRFLHRCQRGILTPVLLWMWIAAVLVSLVPGQSCAQTFAPDDPIWEDPDRLDMPAPEAHSIGDYYDFWVNTFSSPGKVDGPALNINTLGDVPASSWYTPRHYWHPMTNWELARGPNQHDGPSLEGPWEVVAGKLEGKTAGFQIVDARGDRYLFKFDVPGYIELTSGAEVISTKILYALGYNVPQNFAVRFERSRLVPGDEAKMETADGEVAITEARIDAMLAAAATYPDGSFRALASLFLDGEPIGPFLYYGTRPDDGNDIFPHEARRELRGLRTIAAWINHSDTRSINSLDMVVEEDDRQFVRHHLIDFGTTLGVGPFGPKRRWDGFEYIMDGRKMLLRALTLGAAGLDWAAIEYTGEDQVGRIDAEHFDPEGWYPQYPNAAFLREDADDAFWAAKQIMHIGDSAVRAIVESGRFSDARTVDRLVDILTERRDKIGRAFLSHGGGLDRFTVRHGYLTFDDLPAQYGLAKADRVRHAIWRPFDNKTGDIGDILAANPVSSRRISIPKSDRPYLVVEIRTPREGLTKVYLRGRGLDREVVGVERSGS